MPIDRISHLVAPTPGETQSHRRSFFRSFVQFLCSNIGLVIVVIAYSIGGAFLFILLEQYIELQNCQQANLLENVSISNISETMYNYVALSDGNTTNLYEQIVTLLENFTSDIYDRKDEFRYTGQNCSTSSGWTFPSALLFTISVITSIGFGHVTPTTWEGQITCICYALIGIPIFLLCLANISSILGDMFRFLYSAFLRCACCCCRVFTRGRSSRRVKRRQNRNKIEYVGTTSVDPHWPEAYCQTDEEKLSDDEYNMDEHMNDEDEIDDVWTRMESRVPILAVISIIIGYICLGAIMFHNTENWTMTQSVYFCYVTLSTIGFGDYVPGITSGSTEGLRFLGASLYIITGLAVLAMCFDLIKESIVEKFEWFGEKLGIINEDEDQVDKDPTNYANFTYAQQQQQQEINTKNSPPPAYEYATTDGQWIKNIKDKTDHIH